MKKLRKDLTHRIRRGGFPSLVPNLLATLKKAIETGDTATLEKLSEPEPKQEQLSL